MTNSLAFSNNYYDQKILCLAIESRKNISFEKVKKILTLNLPIYSIPKKIKFFKRFPVNINFKIDRKKIKKMFDEK